MSLKKKAAQVRATGYKNSGQDSMLAHITPKEAALLKAHGGSGRTDPQTGLPHFDYGDGGGFGGGDGGFGGYGGFGGSGDFGGGLGGEGGPGFGGSYGGPGFGDGGGDGNSGDPTDLGSVTITGSSVPMPGFGDQSGGFGSLPNMFDTAGFGGAYNGEGFGYQTPDFTNPDTSILDALKKWNKNPIISQLMSMNPITKMANVALKGPVGLGSLFGGLAGSIAGPVGGMIGSHLGGKFGSSLGEGQAIGNANTAMGGAPGGNEINNGLLGGLAGLYLGHRQNQEANSQINNLNGLFAPGSPYATQLRQQLDRRDAAAGRRSQYGPREVELQAALATQAAKMAPTLNQMYQQKSGNRNLMLSTLMNNKSVNGLLNQGLSGLGNLFSGGSNSGFGSNLESMPNYFTGGFTGTGNAPDLGFEGFGG